MLELDAETETEEILDPSELSELPELPEDEEDDASLEYVD